MIDLKALKEQLKLLGHDLPDEQVVAILKEMKIDFNVKPGEHEGAQDPLEGLTKANGGHNHDNPGLPRTGSILDNFQGRQQPQQLTAGLATGVPAQGVSTQGFSYGYTSPANGACVALEHGKLATTMPPVTRAVHNQERGIGEDFRPGAASSDYSDDCYDHDSDEDDITVEPGVSCLPRAPGADKPTSASGRTSATHGSSRYRAEATSVFRQTAGRSSAGVDVRSLARSGRGPSDLTDRLGRVTLNEPVGCTSRLSHLEEIGGKLGRKDLEAAGRLSSSGVQRPGSATAAKDQHRKPNGPTLVMPFDRDTHTLRHRRVKEDDDDEGDVAFSDPDKEHTAHAASMEDLGWLPPGGRTGAPGKSAQNPYPAWLAGVEGPVDARLADALLAQGQLSPQESTRSFASRATSRCSIGSKRGAKKVDRVQRYQQLQQEWSQNRFLKQAGGTSRGTSRKPINFHSHFASLHAAEEAERQRMLRETRARTKKELGAATEAPTANRRDELRWQTRMRLREQT